MTNCYLCEKAYISGEKSYLYLCYDCLNKTSVCLNCDKIMMKIFENIKIFKCGCCRKIVPARSKQLIEINNSSIDLNQLSQLNQLINISAINENNLSPNKNINENNNNNNNSKYETPKENRVIYQNLGNKIFINTPSSVSSLDDLNKVNSELNNQKEMINNSNINNANNGNNLSSLTDINNSFKIKNNFSLIMDNKQIKLRNNKPKGFANLFLFNESKSKNLFNRASESKDQNKNNFSGYNKVINEDKNNLSGYKINIL